MKFSNGLKSNLSAAVLGVLVLGLNCTSAAAGTTTTTFAVTATVQATCVISADTMAFGTYTGVAATGASDIRVTCTNTTPYNVGLNKGLATGATVNTRKMTGTAGAVLGYSLFSNAGRTTNWGETIGTDTVSQTADGTAQVHTVYGAVAAGQYVAPGDYADTITATVTW